jgi:release factor glutamine methyltransferase
LIETVLQEAANHRATSLLDMGTGSGCIAITLALEMPELAVTATDFSEKALAIAKDNAKTLKARISFHQGSWYEALPNDARFDIIVSNPPYIHPQDHHLANLRYEPITALTDGVDGLKDLRAIVADAPNHLNANGLLAMEHGWDQGEAVRNLFDESLWYDVRTIKDLGDNDRVTLGRLKS